MAEHKAYKVVGLVVSVLAALSIIMAAAMWLARSMAEVTVLARTNAVSIELMKEDHLRMDASIEGNAELINQHEKLLTILEQHGAEIKVLTEFMLRGDRYTAEMGKQHEARTTAIENWIKEAPPDWFEAQFLIVVSKIDKLADKVGKNHEEIILLKHQIEVD